MENILFRGFNTKNNRWIYGDLLHNRGETFIAPPGIADPLAMPADFLVSPESIGQFTGLHDKDGRDIYEGDIIEWRGRIYVVEFREGRYYASVCECDKCVLGGCSLWLLTRDDDAASIVGCVHDSPELLKQSTKN